MSERRILLCGGTGELGGEIARRLVAAGVPFRALVRTGSDASGLEALGAEICRGDVRDRASLDPALQGVTTVISTVNTMARLLAGAKDLSIRDVDDRGNATLIAAAEAAGAERFVFASMLGDVAHAHTPFTDAKAATEQRLRESGMREVIVRADAFQEVWFSPLVGWDWQHAKLTIYGKGTARHAYVAIGDVAEAIVRLALAADPPRSIDIAGPEAISLEEAVAAFETATGTPMHVSHIPRIAMRVGRVVTGRVKPALASVMGMSLESDLMDSTARDDGLRGLGIVARPVRQYIKESVAAAAGGAPTRS